MANSIEYEIRPNEGDPFIITTKGRDRWALERLADAGAAGVTPKNEPQGPRWSAYVHNLRGKGVPILTVHEHHGGEFAGRHGRYILLATAHSLTVGGAHD